MGIKVEGLDRLKQKLLQDAAKRMEYPNVVRGESVIVGYTAAYALYVHENLEMKWKGVPRDPRKRSANPQKNPRARKSNPKGLFWDPQGKASSKFLEKPYRQLSNDGTLSNILVTASRRGAKLQHALYLAGLRIQRDSQKLVPVDTGNLKSSAFTRKE